jgi:hypothetical protein
MRIRVFLMRDVFWCGASVKNGAGTVVSTESDRTSEWHTSAGKFRWQPFFTSHRSDLQGTKAFKQYDTLPGPWNFIGIIKHYTFSPTRPRSNHLCTPIQHFSTSLSTASTLALHRFPPGVTYRGFNFSISVAKFTMEVTVQQASPFV